MGDGRSPRPAVSSRFWRHLQTATLVRQDVERGVALWRRPRRRERTRVTFPAGAPVATLAKRAAAPAPPKTRAEGRRRPPFAAGRCSSRAGTGSHRFLCAPGCKAALDSFFSMMLNPDPFCAAAGPRPRPEQWTDPRSTDQFDRDVIGVEYTTTRPAGTPTTTGRTHSPHGTTRPAATAIPAAAGFPM